MRTLMQSGVDEFYAGVYLSPDTDPDPSPDPNPDPGPGEGDEPK
jgi:hypothetical protein